MHLTNYTDYGLRVLLYLAVKEDDATIGEIAERYGISRNHLVKVVHELGKLGYIETFRGKGGGMRLARDPAAINVGEVVERMEPNFHLVECFDREHGACVITPVCKLQFYIRKAQQAFMDVLKSKTLADVVENKGALREHLNIGP